MWSRFRTPSGKLPILTPRQLQTLDGRRLPPAWRKPTCDVQSHPPHPYLQRARKNAQPRTQQFAATRTDHWPQILPSPDRLQPSPSPRPCLGSISLVDPLCLASRGRGCVEIFNELGALKIPHGSRAFLRRPCFQQHAWRFYHPNFRLIDAAYR